MLWKAPLFIMLFTGLGFSMMLVTYIVYKEVIIKKKYLTLIHPGTLIMFWLGWVLYIGLLIDTFKAFFL